MDEDVNQLKYKLSTLGASIPTTNGGGMQRHVGMLLDNTKCVTFLMVENSSQSL